MWVGAMITGLIGGFFGLFYGLWLFAYGGFSEAVEGHSYLTYQLVSVLVPIAGIVGAGMARQMPSLSALLMAGSAAGMYVHFGYGPWTLIIISLLGVGAVLSLLGAATSR
ncbi:MAG: hypothetical protein HXY22_01845 [Alphaproteobacteria bacterium]|nr:hypothetical protein [Alphaproteobacteria bacterium]